LLLTSHRLTFAAWNLPLRQNNQRNLKCVGRLSVTN
jgi:hypothetical protein